jgi:signal transduction histidine kinase
MNQLLLDYLTNHSSFLFLKLDHQGIIISANKFSIKLCGEQIIGKHVQDIFLDFQEKINLSKVLADNEEVLLNLQTTSDLPETFYFRFYQVEDCIEVVGEFNKEEYENLRLELIDLNNELSNKSRELHKKNAELKKLNDLKSHFLNAAAHDLRNPVGNIIRLSEFLLDEMHEKLNEQQSQFLNLIKSLGSFSMNLLNDLLDMARIESGKLILNKKPVDLIGLIKGIIELNEFAGIKKNVRIKLEIFEKIKEIPIDESGIKQVMDNLLNNAIKFSPINTTISVGVFSSKEVVTIYVKDEGEGMSDDQIKKMFVPFSNSAKDMNNSAKGTGLGLSIVEKIIIAHNGKIWVKSEKNRGTTIYFSLPADKDKAAIHQQNS